MAVLLCTELVLLCTEADGALFTPRETALALIIAFGRAVFLAGPGAVRHAR
jgi:hypothetical protein